MNPKYLEVGNFHDTYEQILYGRWADEIEKKISTKYKMIRFNFPVTEEIHSFYVEVQDVIRIMFL